MKLTRRRVIVASITILLAVAAGWYFAASHDEPSTRWHNEEITKDNTTWNGSWPNALETLKLHSHSWKIIQRTHTGGYTWGFKAVIEFPEHPDYIGDPEWDKLGSAVMDITALQYDLYDSDGFHLVSIVLDNLEPVVMRTVATYQETSFMDELEARRAAYGKLNIRAGYQLPNVDRQPVEKVTPHVATPE